MAVGMIIPIIQIIPLIVLMSGSGSSGGPAEMDDAAGDCSSDDSQSSGTQRPLTPQGMIEHVAQAVQDGRSVKIEVDRVMTTAWVRNQLRSANERLMAVVAPPQQAPPQQGPIEVTWVQNLVTDIFFTVRVVGQNGTTAVDVQVFDQQAAGQQVIALS